MFLAGRPAAPPPRAAPKIAPPPPPAARPAPYVVSGHRLAGRPTPAGRPASVSTRSVANAGRSRLAAKIGVTRNQGVAALHQAQLARAIANQSNLAAESPFAPIASSDLLQSRALREMMMQGQFNQDFQTLKNQGLLPPGAKEPPLSFPLRGLGSQGDLSFETGTADAGNAEVHLSPSVLFQATQHGGFTPAHAWALETPIHELAHALQKPSVLRNRPLREGGAQAFADAAAIKAIGPISENDTNYSQFVRNVLSKRGSRFVMRGQFG